MNKNEFLKEVCSRVSHTFLRPSPKNWTQSGTAYAAGVFFANRLEDLQQERAGADLSEFVDQIVNEYLCRVGGWQ